MRNSFLDIYGDLLIHDFGTINWEVLEPYLNNIGETDLRSNLEKQLYRLCLDNINPRLESFYPHDSSLEYQLGSNDKSYTKAIKTFINIIYKYQQDIVVAARLTRNDLDLILVEGEDKLNPSSLDESKISNENLGKLLDKNFDTVGKWIRNIETYKANIKSFIDLRLFIENSPFYKSVIHVQKLILLSLDQFIFNDIVSNILYSFSKYSHATFSMQDLSQKFDMNAGYLAKFETESYSTRGEEHTKFFRLLSIVYLADPNKFNLIDNNDYEKIKKEVHDEVFDGMVRRGKIKDKNYRLDFDALFYTVLAMTKAEMNTPNVKHNLYPLTRLAELMGHDRSFFRQKMLLGTGFSNTQAYEMRDEMGKVSADTLASEFYKLACDNLDKVIEKNGEFVKNDYIKYYWNYLYGIQVVELLKITLGLDIWGLEFIKDAELKGEKYKIDIKRHHLEKIKSIYTMFKFSEDVDFSTKLIPFKDFVIALAPLMGTHHGKLDQSSGFNYNMQLAMHRLMHLYELIQFPLVENFDYQSTFLHEFHSKMALIDGKEVKIWDKLEDGKIEIWINRWLTVKKNGYEAFFLDKDDGYSNFYKFRYLPIEKDFRLFVNGKKSMNDNLFLSEKMRNSFWRWFLSTYLRENIYPRI